jgi:hypothetical protein
MGEKFYLVVIQLSFMTGPVMVYQSVSDYYTTDGPQFNLKKFEEEMKEVCQEELENEIINLTLINRIEVTAGEYYSNATDS